MLSGHRGEQSTCSSPEAVTVSFVISPVGFFREKEGQFSTCCFHSFDDGQMKCMLSCEENVPHLSLVPTSNMASKQPRHHVMR